MFRASPCETPAPCGGPASQMHMFAAPRPQHSRRKEIGDSFSPSFGRFGRQGHTYTPRAGALWCGCSQAPEGAGKRSRAAIASPRPGWRRSWCAARCGAIIRRTFTVQYRQQRRTFFATYGLIAAKRARDTTRRVNAKRAFFPVATFPERRVAAVGEPLLTKERRVGAWARACARGRVYPIMMSRFPSTDCLERQPLRDAGSLGRARTPALTTQLRRSPTGCLGRQPYLVGELPGVEVKAL